MRLFLKRLRKIAVQILPAAVTVGMVLLSVIPLRVAGMPEMLSFLPLISLYYWGVFAPASLPYSFVFVLGFVQDALMGTPLGLSSGMNVAVMLLISSLRRFMGKNLFSTLWMGFAAVILAACMIQWGVMSLYEGRMLSFGVQVFPLLVTLFIYPWVHILLSRFTRYNRP